MKINKPISNPHIKSSLFVEVFKIHSNIKMYQISRNPSDTGMKKSNIIGNYSLGKTIGEGTFGKVKLGVHIQTEEKVAIKILEKDRICDVSDIERVSRELHILKLIRHPNIIQLYEVNPKQIIETPKKLYLIMEYASGGELFEFIVKHKKIKEKEACRFFQQLVAGVEYINKLNVVHRDLKPENLLLDHKFNIKIVDFGLSNTFKPGELLKTACGSPCYAAPEMIAGKRYEGLKADLWSCGVILFAAVCGYLPFEDSNTNTLYKKILAGDFHFPKFISPEVKDLLKGILNTSPEARMGIEEIRQHLWFGLVKEEIQPGILIGYDHIVVDVEILKQLEKYGYNLDYCKKCLEANKHNNVTTAYYLLLKKYIQLGGVSVADYGYRPDNQQERSVETSGLLLPTRKRVIKVNNRTGSVSGNKDVDTADIKSFRNTSERSSKQRKVSESPQSRGRNEISFGLRLLFKKASTPRPPSMQKTGIKVRGKTPGMKGIELAPLSKYSPKPANEGKLKFKHYH
jgi:5'-AMP-activated protein kinase catalytic alpha subunit